MSSQEVYSICEYCKQPKPANDHKRCIKCRTIKHNDSYSKLYYRYVSFNHRYNLNLNWELFKEKIPDNLELHKSGDRIYLLTASETSRLSSKVNPTTGYKRIYYSRVKLWYYWQINVDGKTYTKANFKTANEAALDLDEWIIANDITATLSDGSEHYRKDAKWIDLNELIE